jgi:hypothetical protein
LAVIVVSARLDLPAATYAAVFMMVGALAGVTLAAAHRPTKLRAARVADHQSKLRNRLATAVEILDDRISSELNAFQLAETTHAVAALPAARAFPRSTLAARNGALVLAAAVALLVTAVLALPPNRRVAETVAVVEPEVVATERASGAEAVPLTQAVISPQQLEQMRARSFTEQAALSQLAVQLLSSAAAREVGQALERGDVAVAGALLNQLALDSDQLSQPAKQELAGALLNASKGTAALDKNLAAAELAATVAMTRSSYQAARNALQGLAAAVLESRTGTLTQQQLMAQIQQLERDVAAQTGGNGTDCGVLTDDGEFFQDCSAVGQAPSSGAMGVVSRGTGESPSAGVGEVAGGHGFASSGVDLDPLGQAPTHLSLRTADIPVDLSLSGAQGNGATSDQRSPTVAISQSRQGQVQQPGVPQSSEPVQQETEQTVVAPADRAIVRDFFRAADAAQP